MLQIVLFHAEAHDIDPGSSYPFLPANMVEHIKVRRENLGSIRTAGRIQYWNLIIKTISQSKIFPSPCTRVYSLIHWFYFKMTRAIISCMASYNVTLFNLGAFKMRNCAICIVSVGLTHFPCNIS